jgi:hypothetical protein
LLALDESFPVLRFKTIRHENDVIELFHK